MTQVHRTGSNPQGTGRVGAFIARSKSGDHLGIGGWIILMSFRPEAFRLNFRHVKFWRGCLRFLVKRRQPLS